MLFILIILTLLLEFKYYLEYKTIWVYVFDTSMFKSGNIAEIEGKKFKIIKINHFSNELKLRETILGF